MFGLSAMQDNNLPLMPVLPVLGRGITLFKPDNPHSILDYPHISFVSSGASAIYYALKSHGVGKDDEVLIPAYHCPAMVEPVIQLGAKPIFYSITRSIEIDAGSIKEKINYKTSAILVPHFFGIQQDVGRLRRACELSESVCIIEDCAHAFFTSSKDSLNINPSDSGDYVIASLTKFFPTHDGGVLASNNKRVADAQSLSIKQEIKAAYNVIHDAVRFGRLKFLAWVFSLISLIRSSNSQQRDDEVVENEAVGMNEYVADYHEQISLSASKACKYIVTHANFNEIISKRQKNYRYILQELKDEADIDLSLNCLDEDFIPYMVVIRLLNPSKHHPKLIANRLPIWRWEHIYPSECQVSKEYSQSIIQVPCHQQLTHSELTSMVDGIKKCLRSD